MNDKEFLRNKFKEFEYAYRDKCLRMQSITDIKKVLEIYQKLTNKTIAINTRCNHCVLALYSEMYILLKNKYEKK